MSARDVASVITITLLLAGFFFLFRWCIAVLWPGLSFGQTLAAAALFTTLAGVASKD